MKIPKELKVKYHTDYSDKTSFASKARLLQSIWREERGFDYDKKIRFGNYLILQNAMEKGENFLNKRIFDCVKSLMGSRLVENKVIQEPRIWTNMLSSQPMAFNLFGEMVYNKDLCKRVFNETFPERKISEVYKVEFEYSPQRRSEKYTNDNSAFDVFIEYTNDNNENCFFGIEIKYAEDMNDKPSSHKKEYDEVALKSCVFKKEKLPQLMQRPLQQIWRDHLLALSMFKKNDDYKVGDFIFLYPDGNSSCRLAINEYRKCLKSNMETFFHPLTLESLIGSIKKHCNEDWVGEFENRYLSFKKIEELVNRLES